MGRAIGIVIVILMAISAGYAQRGGGQAGPPQTPKAAAPIDLTGTWVPLITEDWRVRMVTPKKGDYESVPISNEGRKVADGWDPAKDEAASQQCKAYGAGAVARVVQPGARGTCDAGAHRRRTQAATRGFRDLRHQRRQAAAGG